MTVTSERVCCPCSNNNSCYSIPLYSTGPFGHNEYGNTWWQNYGLESRNSCKQRGWYDSQLNKCWPKGFVFQTYKFGVDGPVPLGATKEKSCMYSRTIFGTIGTHRPTRKPTRYPTHAPTPKYRRPTNQPTREPTQKPTPNPAGGGAVDVSSVPCSFTFCSNMQ